MYLNEGLKCSTHDETKCRTAMLNIFGNKEHSQISDSGRYKNVSIAISNLTFGLLQLLLCLEFQKVSYINYGVSRICALNLFCSVENIIVPKTVGSNCIGYQLKLGQILKYFVQCITVS